MTAHIFLARLEESVLASFATGPSTESLHALAVLSILCGVQSSARLASNFRDGKKKLTDISACFNCIYRQS